MIIAAVSSEAVGATVGAGIGLGLAFVVAVIQALIGALFVQVATKWVCQFKPAYGMAFKAVLVVVLIMFVINAAGRILALNNLVGSGLSTVVGFLVGAAIYGKMIKGPSGAIGMGKGILVSLVAAIVGLLIAVLVGIIAAVLLGAA
ncbi:MAG TPA: hypothetical protein P5186_23370 [Candidatus Paceibacterota bacterium]|nr:hypothetical protein [Verrucomicrobiota bacterium]HRY50999.1 hypothetical protein [Candidatus Paceibacterota bacterium]HSA01113.1 hypothetical protein [Candidatus Paceibacterota bacterium]